MKFVEGDLVMLRLQTSYGYSNTWWRVMFIDNDETFIGKLERLDRSTYETHSIGDIERFPITLPQRLYKEGEVFCYSDNITICNCSGLCREK